MSLDPKLLIKYDVITYEMTNLNNHNNIWPDLMRFGITNPHSGLQDQFKLDFDYFPKSDWFIRVNLDV